MLFMLAVFGCAMGQWNGSVFGRDIELIAHFPWLILYRNFTLQITARVTALLGEKEVVVDGVKAEAEEAVQNSGRDPVVDTDIMALEEVVLADGIAEAGAVAHPNSVMVVVFEVPEGKVDLVDGIVGVQEAVQEGVMVTNLETPARAEMGPNRGRGPNQANNGMLGGLLGSLGMGGNGKAPNGHNQHHTPGGPGGAHGGGDEADYRHARISRVLALKQISSHLAIFGDADTLVR
ncbi:unnamed protein product, partial [Mesorhabditis spiculigera]